MSLVLPGTGSAVSMHVRQRCEFLEIVTVQRLGRLSRFSCHHLRTSRLLLRKSIVAYMNASISSQQVTGSDEAVNQKHALFGCEHMCFSLVPSIILLSIRDHIYI